MHVFTERPPPPPPHHLPPYAQQQVQGQGQLEQQGKQQQQGQQQRVVSSYYAAYVQEKEKRESACRLLAVEQERLSECKRERDRLSQELSDLTREYRTLQHTVAVKTAEQNQDLQNKLALARDQHIHSLQDQQQYLAMMLTGTISAQHHIMDSVLQKCRTLVPTSILQRIPQRKTQAELQMWAMKSRQPIQNILIEEENTRRQQIGEVVQKEIRSLATNASDARVKVNEIEKNMEVCKKQIQDTERVIKDAECSSSASSTSSSSSSSSSSSIVVYDPGTAQKRSELQLKLDTARDLLQTLTIEHTVLMRAIAFEEQKQQQQLQLQRRV